MVAQSVCCWMNLFFFFFFIHSYYYYYSPGPWLSFLFNIYSFSCSSFLLLAFVFLSFHCSLCRESQARNFWRLFLFWVSSSSSCSSAKNPILLLLSSMEREKERGLHSVWPKGVKTALSWCVFKLWRIGYHCPKAIAMSWHGFVWKIMFPFWVFDLTFFSFYLSFPAGYYYPQSLEIFLNSVAWSSRQS